jgi:hypothetical protein
VRAILSQLQRNEHGKHRFCDTLRRLCVSAHKIYETLRTFDQKAIPGFPGDLMKRPFVALSLLICFAFSLAVFLPAPMAVQASDSLNPASADPSVLGKAQAYCLNHGGEVDTRAPFFNTNAEEQAWLRLSGDRQFCKFTSKTDGSRIHIRLSTLHSNKPTMAALAYYAEVPYGGNLQRQSGILLLLAAWRYRSFWRN